MDKSKVKTYNMDHIPDGNDPNHPVRIYTDGCFDCFHFGHAKVLQQCKQLFKYTYVIVGVCSDVETVENKGKNLMTQDERAECVRHCKWADEVIVPCLWIPTMEFFEEKKIHYLARDALPYPYKGNPDLYSPMKEIGRFLPTKRTEGISTTDMIVRIIKDRDMYIDRSLKKGVKASELNIFGAEAAHYLFRVIASKIVSNSNRVVIDIARKLKEYKSNSLSK